MMKPYYEDDSCTIYHGDCREALSSLAADVIVTDPPYGLAFMGRAWDKVDQGFHQEWAALAFQSLPPGGWLLAFGGTRTWHRLACGLEDAGLEVRDTLMWLYGQGFAKGEACLKPAWEPILLARKPGSSVLQIAASRLEGVVQAGAGTLHTFHGGRDGYQPGTGRRYQTAGRWPANVILDSEVAELLDQQSGPSRASRFFYTAKAGRNERITVDGEQHSTVKPLALMRWLVRLVTPPGGTVLDPFCGSGSTLVAAALEGHRAVGIEAEERWCEGSAKRCRERPAVQEALVL